MTPYPPLATILHNLILGLSLAAPLGPSGLAIIQTGLKRGFLAALITGVGVTLADATYFLLVYFGLAGLMGRPAVKVLVWGLGSAVLLHLGVQSLREARGRIDLDKATLPERKSPLLVGYLVNISNPLAIVWWLGVFGSVLGMSAGEGRVQTLVSSSAILAGILLWHATMSALAHWGRRILNARNIRLISLVAGAALVFFALRFAYNAVSTILR